MNTSTVRYAGALYDGRSYKRMPEPQCLEIEIHDPRLRGGLSGFHIYGSPSDGAARL